MLYVAIALYVSTAHWVEVTGLHHVCRLVAEETKINSKARRVADYAIPVVSRVVATVLIVVMTGKLVKEG